MAIDYSVFTAEPYDPCAALNVIRPIYFKLILEPGIKRVTFRDRTVEYAPGDAKLLLGLINQLEADCAAASGKRRNFAITAGAGPRCCFGDPFRR